MDKFKVPPLKAVSFKARPSKRHGLAWSCDGELAVAADESLHVFLPHYRNADSGDEATGDREQYYSSPLRLLIPRKPDPRLNLRYLVGSDRHEPDATTQLETEFMGYGINPVTGFGSALNQVMSVEWSPSGMGPNQRPILTAAITRGAIIAWGEAIPPRNSDVDLFDTRSRGFRFWKTLWGIGAYLPLPDASSATGFSTSGDRITSYSWARQTPAAGQGLIAYLTDSRDLVIMSVQYCEQDETLEARWRIDEVYRARLAGPHGPRDVHFPLFIKDGRRLTPYTGLRPGLHAVKLLQRPQMESMAVNRNGPSIQDGCSCIPGSPLPGQHSCYDQRPVGARRGAGR
jgi:hypothetical protein